MHATQYKSWFIYCQKKPALPEAMLEFAYFREEEVLLDLGENRAGAEY